MRELETWLQQFGEFVLKAQLVKEKAAPYCVRWVRRFLTRPASEASSCIYEDGAGTEIASFPLFHRRRRSPPEATARQTLHAGRSAGGHLLYAARARSD